MSERNRDPENVEKEPWGFFDRVYCISVAGRDDRLRSARLAFAEAGLLPRVEFVIVNKHPSNSEQGIFESHMKCIELGLQHKANTMLVFEDDILLESPVAGALKNAVDFLQSGTAWDLFFLGCFVSKSWPTGFENVLRVRFRSTNHAYAIHARFAERLVNHNWNGKAYDDFLRDMQDTRFFAIFPSIAFQSESPTDNIVQRRVNRLRRLCGGLRWLQKQNEFFHRHTLTIIAIHLAVIGIAIGLVLLIRK